MSRAPLRLLAVPVWGQAVASAAGVWCLWRVAGESLPALDGVPALVAPWVPWVHGAGPQALPLIAWTVVGAASAWALRTDRRAAWAALLCGPTVTGALYGLAVIASDPAVRPPPDPDDPAARLVVVAMLLSLLSCLPSVGVLRWWRAEWAARTSDAPAPEHPLQDRRRLGAAAIALLAHGLVLFV